MSEQRPNRAEDSRGADQFAACAFTVAVSAWQSKYDRIDPNTGDDLFLETAISAAIRELGLSSIEADNICLFAKIEAAAQYEISKKDNN